MAQTILVIDDTASLRQVVAMALKGAGYAVLEAGDGAAALALLDRRKSGMAICDVNMPRMNGIEFVKAAKALPAYRFLRDVLIYFDAATKSEVVDRVLEVLRPGGLFFLGTAEGRVPCKTPLKTLQPGVFRKAP
ncbi:MAG: response regulator [Rhodoferax sp.]|nr:response regulator [Rhodoferax sp.]